MLAGISENDIVIIPSKNLKLCDTSCGNSSRNFEKSYSDIRFSFENIAIIALSWRVKKII